MPISLLDCGNAKGWILELLTNAQKRPSALTVGRGRQTEPLNQPDSKSRDAGLCNLAPSARARFAVRSGWSSS